MTESKNIRESFDQKVIRLLNAPLPTTQKDLIASTNELSKIASQFDSRIANLQESINHLQVERDAVQRKMGDSYISLGKQFSTP